jgi:hypothetical protein
MDEICQKSLPDAPWLTAATRKLPGVQPLDMANWLVVDDAYAPQMAERARLLGTRPGDVLAYQNRARPAAQELYDLVLSHLAQTPGYRFAARHCIRPDGAQIPLNRAAPLETLCHLIAEDLCILEKHEAEHVLTAALLCFPASWSLAEKFGRPLTTIHAPVDSYSDDMARRVQRLFDAVKPGRPLWRANALSYADPTLYQPRTMAQRRGPETRGHYLRSERQCILRLPKSGAVVFSIHTRQLRMADLTQEQRAGLEAHPLSEAL